MNITPTKLALLLGICATTLFSCKDKESTSPDVDNSPTYCLLTQELISGSVNYDYIYDNDVLIAAAKGNDTTTFHYDGTGKLDSAINKMANTATYFNFNTDGKLSSYSTYRNKVVANNYNLFYTDGKLSSQYKYVGQSNLENFYVFDYATKGALDSITAWVPSGMKNGPQHEVAATFKVASSDGKKNPYYNNIAMYFLKGDVPFAYLMEDNLVEMKGKIRHLDIQEEHSYTYNDLNYPTNSDVIVNGNSTASASYNYECK